MRKPREIAAEIEFIESKLEELYDEYIAAIKYASHHCEKGGKHDFKQIGHIQIECVKCGYQTIDL